MADVNKLVEDLITLEKGQLESIPGIGSIAEAEQRGLLENDVANFSYTDEALSTNDCQGVLDFTFGRANNIPDKGPGALYTEQDVLDTGYQTQVSSSTRQAENHFRGRVSFNLNKMHNFFANFLKNYQKDLSQNNNLYTTTTPYYEGDVCFVVLEGKKEEYQRTAFGAQPSVGIPTTNTDYWLKLTVDIPEPTAGIPVGAIIDSLEDNIEGFIRLEGQTLEKSQYVALNAIYESIGYPNGSTDTTFNLIDARNRVTRGVGNLTGTNVGEMNVGETQEDAMQPITGYFDVGEYGSTGRLLTIRTSGAFSSSQYSSNTGYVTASGSSSRAKRGNLDSSLVTRTAAETRVKSFSTYKHQKY